MIRYLKMVERDDGWTDFIFPKHRGYRMSCCDCGLVHELDFDVVEIESTGRNTFRIVREVSDLRVRFKARRAPRSTAQVRRRMRRETCP